MNPFPLSLLFFLGLATARAQTPAIEIASPAQATIYAKSSLQRHVLYWSKQKQELSASLEFTDDVYTDTTGHNETFDFPLPGVSFDQKSGLFTVDDGRGTPLPVAKRRTVAFITEIEPTPNAAFHIRHEDGGKIGVVLTVYRPEVAAALQALPQPQGDEKTMPMQSLFQK